MRWILVAKRFQRGMAVNIFAGVLIIWITHELHSSFYRFNLNSAIKLLNCKIHCHPLPETLTELPTVFLRNGAAPIEAAFSFKKSILEASRKIM